jgi:translation initiation factor IF-1
MVKNYKKFIIPEKNDGFIIPPEGKGDIPHYSNLAQDYILDHITEKRNEIIKNDKIDEINERIIEFSKTTGVNENKYYQSPNKFVIATAIDLLGQSTRMLDVADRYYFERGNEKKEISRIFTDIDYDKIKKEMVKKIEEVPIHQILKIKIADFLGKSRWKFKLVDGKTIDAKIEDKTWLNLFHSKQVKIGSGDSIEIDGVVTITYDAIGNIIDTQYTISKVGLIHEANHEQSELDF